ncbi:MAG: thiolase family protein [Elusimicrobia bacterium]|nr:thiolase family protein [Elusimicrobiota bacterium]
MADDIVILAGARTPFGAWSGGTDGSGAKGGRLQGQDPFDLAAAALKAALAGSGLEPRAVDEVVFGNAYHVGPHACYGGRYVGHRAGLPDSSPGKTVGLACGSGLYAVAVAAQDLRLGAASIAAAAGADAPSMVRKAVLIPSFTDLSAGEAIAASTHRTCLEAGISREDQDRWALRSHALAGKAQKSGLFASEIVQVPGLAADDLVLRDPAPEHFTRSEPLFEGSTPTHASVHGIADGGSALLLARGPAAGRIEPLGRLLADAVTSEAPRRMALACAGALKRAVSEAGVRVEDIDLFEINETFAGQVLADIKELGIPEEKVNVNGGAIALGHAFGGTGGRLVLTLLKELGRRNLRLGAAAISVGGGQGVAVVVER